MRRVFLFLLACCLSASATNYYVSSSSGNDSNAGTSSAAPWKTFSAAGNHVNSGSFAPGDVIYLKRGDTWNEQLIPPSSGEAGNPIAFDAYGTGAAPIITAAASIPFLAGSWTFVSGNVWKTAAPGLVTGMGAATTVDMVQFGAVYGRPRPNTSGCASSIASKYDWCVVWPNLYVYSGNSSTPPTVRYASDGAITAYVDSGTGVSMISLVNKSWITFQHIKVQGFSYIGVGVTGTSDNLVFANMESDGTLPYQATPHGFYVNVSGGYGTNIQFVNDESLLCGKSGAEKKDAAMSFLESALQTIDAVAAREIVDSEKFKNGISKIIDGTVECLNASTWSKGGAQSSNAPASN